MYTVLRWLDDRAARDERIRSLLLFAALLLLPLLVGCLPLLIKLLLWLLVLPRLWPILLLLALKSQLPLHIVHEQRVRPRGLRRFGLPLRQLVRVLLLLLRWPGACPSAPDPRHPCTFVNRTATAPSWGAPRTDIVQRRRGQRRQRNEQRAVGSATAAADRHGRPYAPALRVHVVGREGRSGGAALGAARRRAIPRRRCRRPAGVRHGRQCARRRRATA